MIKTEKSSLLTIKNLVRTANPEFFSEEMIQFIGNTHNEWSISEFKGQPCVLVERPASQAVACYLIHPLTYKLTFKCHIAGKLTYI